MTNLHSIKDEVRDLRDKLRTWRDDLKKSEDPIAREVAAEINTYVEKHMLYYGLAKHVEWRY